MSTQHEVNPYSFTMTGGLGVYDLHWPEQNITMHVSHFTDKPLTAEVWVDSQRPNGGHIASGTLNLLSNVAKGTFEKACARRDDGVDWYTLIEQLCTAVVRDYRKGSPEIELTGEVLKDVSFEDKWVAEPLLLADQPTLIFGEGGSGKSYLAIYLAVLLGEGISSGGIKVTEPLKVLYLDWETSQQEISERLVRVRRGLGLDLYAQRNVIYKHMSSGIREDLSEIQSIVTRRDIQVVVLDSVGAAVAGEPESASMVIAYFNAIRKLKVTSLSVDHKNREGTIFGSSYKRNYSRLMYDVKSAPGTDLSIEMGLFHEKTNNTPYMKPMGWVLRFDNNPDTEAVTFERRDVKDTALESDMSVPDRIENALSNGPKSVQSLAEELEKSTSFISKELSKGRDKRFVNLERGTWANAYRPDGGAFNEEL